MMELSNALEEDLKSALDVCENEATKPTSVTVADLRRAVETGFLHADGASSHSKSTAFTAEEEVVTKEQSAKGKAAVAASPAKAVQTKTEKNTLLNGVSKLPLLVQKAEPTAKNSENAPRDRPFDNVYAQLPQYDAAAIAYVRSFDAPKRSKVWKWCKQSAPEVSKSVQSVFPTVKGPVELVQDGPGAPIGSPKSPLALKSPATPEFRRRAGHSSKKTINGRIQTSVDYFVRDRNQSVGSAGMLPSFMGDKPGSPTESAEDARRRALKFMLNDRETHYDLLSREVVDAVTLMQMEQARALAAAKRKRDAELSDPKASASGPSELDVHQYRTHQLLSADYSGRDSPSGTVNPEEEYSLYVSLPEMSAHSALTARQAVRLMQSTSANISLQTVSKVHLACVFLAAVSFSPLKQTIDNNFFLNDRFFRSRRSFTTPHPPLWPPGQAPQPSTLTASWAAMATTLLLLPRTAPQEVRLPGSPSSAISRRPVWVPLPLWATLPLWRRPWRARPPMSWTPSRSSPRPRI